MLCHEKRPLLESLKIKICSYTVEMLVKICGLVAMLNTVNSLKTYIVNAG